MKLKLYVNGSFSNELDSEIIPRIGEAIRVGKAEFRVVDIIWRIKIDGTKLLHARVYLK